MSACIAALPMYEWPEVRGEVDAEWERLRAAFLAAGLDVPESLVRRNSDMPPVPGGIRDAAGALIAPDPASLPSEKLDFQTLWKHPALLFAQTCWGPLEMGLAEHVEVVGQPSYDGILGGQGIFYSSAIVMRKGVVGRAIGEGGEKGEQHPAIPLDLIRGSRFAFNNPDSMSGLIALTRDLEAMGESLDIFSEQSETGGHRLSIIAVAEGRADVCAIDCRSWQLAQRFEPHAHDVQVVGWTSLRKGLPYITSRHTPPDVVAKLKTALATL